MSSFRDESIWKCTRNNHTEINVCKKSLSNLRQSKSKCMSSPKCILMMSCDLPWHGLSCLVEGLTHLRSDWSPDYSVDIGPQWASYNPLLRLRLFRSPHVRICFCWTLLTSIRHNPLGKSDQPPMGMNLAKILSTHYWPISGFRYFDSPKINFV